MTKCTLCNSEMSEWKKADFDTKGFGTHFKECPNCNHKRFTTTKEKE